MPYRGILLPCALLLASCNREMISPTPEVPPTSARMLSLSGTVLRLGSDDALASPDEKPGWMLFAHDVWLDTTEMTQSEYESLRGTNPSKVRGDDLPVTNVSWYDAVLAANARSRRDGLDSVYEHGAVQSDSSGNTWGLQGLAVHLDRPGWRLPTEAEWEAAARAGTGTPWTWGTLSDSVQEGASAWYQVNAGGTPRAVATKSPNAWGLHDMAGNVMEWVNDWKGRFPQDTVQDFAGPEAPGDVAEVPLKGGAYSYGISHLRPSSRTATYAAYRSARAEYVGFRLARGGFAARYTSPSGEVVYTPPVTLVRTDVARLAGSWEARLVFVNRANGKGTLTWIDYGEASPVARSLPDEDPVFHPAISPDGRWVAWSTVLEGSTQTGRIKARRLSKNDTVVLDLGEGAIPRWWVDGSDTFLVRSSAMDNLSSGWSDTRTTARRWSNGTLPGSEETWVQSGGYHDGRSGRYLYTGYRRLRQWDMVGKSSRVLFTAPGNGKDAGDTSQVCNVSAAPDTSGRVMFLDFGFAGTSGVVGRSYGIHEVAFVADATGAIVRQIVSPSGEAQWEHMEWSNAGRWAVSGSIDRSGAYRNLYLVDVDSESATRIVGGEELWQPGLWVGKGPPVFAGDADPDSSGAWNTPPGVVAPAQEEFSILTRAFWPQRGRIEILALGSSRTKAGIVPEVFRQGVAFNWGFSGSEPVLDKTVLDGYALNHCPKLKVVILSVMPGWLFSFRKGSVWQSVVRSNGFLYDQAHDFWKKGIPSGYLERVASRSWPSSPQFDSMGGVLGASNAWNHGETPPCDASTYQKFDSPVFVENFNSIKSMADSCRARGIHLILVNFPQDPAYVKTACMGRYGPDWDVWQGVKSMIQKIESDNPLFHFYDAHEDGMHDYPDTAAINYDHLSRYGAEMISRRLDSIIATF